MQEHTLSDVRMKHQALEVLLSYSPFWLAVGLQAVAGKAMPVTAGKGRSVPATAPVPPASHIVARLRFPCMHYCLLVRACTCLHPGHARATMRGEAVAKRLIAT